MKPPSPARSMPSPPTAPPLIFDRGAVRRHRERAAASWADHDFLFREIAERLLDRLDDVKRAFPCALDLGCRGGTVAALLAGRGGIRTLVNCDLSLAMTRRAGGLAVVGDEEALPFADGAFDVILSNLSLHWVNDLPGALIQLRRALKPDGLLLASVFGGTTLHELRSALLSAESTTRGGVAPRISPFADIRDVGALLQRAGFVLPVVDSDILRVAYSDPLRLLADLRGMGESNALNQRQRAPLRRDTLAEALRRYPQQAATDSQATPQAAHYPATFEVLFLTAWSPEATPTHPPQEQL